MMLSDLTSLKLAQLLPLACRSPISCWLVSPRCLHIHAPRLLVDSRGSRLSDFAKRCPEMPRRPCEDTSRRRKSDLPHQEAGQFVGRVMQLCESEPGIPRPGEHAQFPLLMQHAIHSKVSCTIGRSWLPYLIQSPLKRQQMLSRLWQNQESTVTCSHMASAPSRPSITKAGRFWRFMADGSLSASLPRSTIHRTTQVLVEVMARYLGY